MLSADGITNERLICVFFLATLVASGITACSSNGGSGVSSNIVEPEPEPTLADARVLPHPLIEAANTRSANNEPYSSGNEPDDYRVLFDPDFNEEDIRALRGVVHSVEPVFVSTEFDGTNVTVEVDPLEAMDFTFDTETDSVEETLPRYPLPDSPVPGHTLREWTTFKVSDEQTVYGHVLVSWDDSDPMNYLAGGYWTNLRGDITEGLITSITSATVGAFVDGPELAGIPLLPDLGTATYRGRASGQYTYFYGSSWDDFPFPEGVPSVTSGTWDTGVYTGTIELIANFGKQTIAGCLGCLLDDADPEFLVLETAGDARLPSGERKEVKADYSGIYSASRVYFDETPIRADGTWSGDNVRLEIDYHPVGASTSGTWGGKFSTIPDTAGDPRLAAGTTAVEWSHPAGDRAMFVGNFIAGKHEHQ